MEISEALDRNELMDFESFQHGNRYKVNVALNKVLWFCILAGPAIALGIMFGVFKRTTYPACVILSLVMAAVAGGNSVMLKKRPYSYVPGVFALIATDLLLCYMNCSHISIRLTWVLVPLLSLLFCDTKVYIGTSIFNYIVMGLATWLEAPNYAQIRTDFSTPLGGFINIFAGCTIEALVIFAAGYALSKATNNYYKKMIGQYAETITNQKTQREQLNILDSMAEIYDFVNLIDFKESTEMSLREEKLHKIAISEDQDHTHMVQGLRNQIAPDMVDEFWRFTNIKTVPARLINRKSIAGEFVSNNMGWFRAQYIRVEGEINEKPDVVIYTIQNIDADKRREEQLLRISRTDELTRLYNRRCYEEDIAALRDKGLSGDLALISADVNGLKAANDEKGHAAGDELLRAAASCLVAAIGSDGKIYRTGGDEFIAIVHSNNCDEMIYNIKKNAASWKGNSVDTVSISLGYAAHAEEPKADIAELERLADVRMYEDKANYYRSTGKDRRQS